MRYSKENDDSFEMCYKIPNWEALELPKPTLNRLRDKSLSWFKSKLSWAGGYFGEQRCENLDIVATYRPYHFNGHNFGVYIYVRYFTAFFLNILERTKLSLKESHTLALQCVLAHSAFHYLVERFAEYHASSGYLNYKRDVYSHCWGTRECLEETLANNYVFQNHPEWINLKVRYVNQLYTLQRGGYVEAANSKELDLSRLYSKLEFQIKRKDESPDSHLLQMWIKQNIPFDADQLPVYLVNDGFEDVEFEEILELLFPTSLEYEKLVYPIAKE